MRNAVLVRSSLRAWDFVLLIAVGILVIGLGVLAALTRMPGLPIILFLAGGAALAGGVFGWHRRVRQRRWCRDLGHGFILFDHLGEKEIRDEDVVTLSLELKNHFSGGVLESYTRTLRVWVASAGDQPDKIELRTTLKANEPDLLQPLIQRLCQRLFDQAEQDLKQGLSALGEYWTWHNGELQIREKQQTKTCRIEDITAVDMVDGHVCIWREGQDEVWAQVPQSSANAYLLEWLLVKELSQRQQKHMPPAEEGLGRIIFQRDSRKLRGIGLTLAILVFLGGVVVLVIALNPRNSGLLWVPPVCLLAALLLGIYEASCWRSIFRCHEYGVFHRTLWSERSLRYTEVKAFTWSAVRQFVNGVYTGTTLHVCFEPEEGKEKITYSATLQNPDLALDNLRDHIGRVLAAKMLKQLQEGETVIWTPRIKILPDGLLYKPAGFLGSKPQQLIPFDQIYSYDLREGYFYLWLKGQIKKPFISEIITQRNFFPGFFLLCMLMHPLEPPQEPPPVPPSANEERPSRTLPGLDDGAVQNPEKEFRDNPSRQ